MVGPQQLEFFEEAGLVCEYTYSRVLAPFPNPTWPGKRLGRVANKTLYRVWFIKIFQHNNSHAIDKNFPIIIQYTSHMSTDAPHIDIHTPIHNTHTHCMHTYTPHACMHTRNKYTNTHTYHCHTTSTHHIHTHTHTVTLTHCKFNFIFCFVVCVDNFNDLQKTNIE